MPVTGPGYYYFDCAKTATQAVTTILKGQYGGVLAWNDAVAAARDRGKYVFATVRNPYDRALSLWHVLCRPGDYHGVVAAGVTDPAACIRYLADGSYRRLRRAAGRTTREHLSETCSEWCGPGKLDAVVRFESLLEDVNRLPFIKAPLAEMPVVNRKPGPRPPRWPLDLPAFRGAVEEWMADDFERFGYEVGVMPEEIA